jgi:hypothetical protein
MDANNLNRMNLTRQSRNHVGFVATWNVVKIGQDAEMILGLRRSLDDQAFEDAMRKALGFTW